MNSNTPTPETDYAFEGDLSVGVNPEITTWQQAKEYARKLERERNMLQAKLTALGGLAVSGWDNKTVGEVDSLISAEKQLEYKDLLRSLFVDIPAERDQLRKVCDLQSEMIKWYVKEFGMPRWGFEFDKLKAIDSLYHQLPHVKDRTK